MQDNFTSEKDRIWKKGGGLEYGTNQLQVFDFPVFIEPFQNDQGPP